MSTIIKKDLRGRWSATSSHPLPKNRVLNIKTYRNHSGDLVTTASVATVDGMFETHKLYEDFYETLGRSRPARLTGKIVEEEHMKYPAYSIIERVEAHYKEE